jgi:hypothetical protein
VRQVMLIDAPAVLGWQRWRELDEVRTLGRIKAALRRDGRIPATRVDLFAHVLLAGMNEIALLVARADDHASAAAEAEAAAGDLLDRLLRT